MTDRQPEIIANAIRSEAENVPDIQSLIARAHDLSQSVDWWNTAMLWTLGFAALAAAVVVITTRMAIVRAGQLADVQDRIIELREADANLKITAAQQAAGAANERAGKLEQDAARLNKEAEDERLARVGLENKLETQKEKTANAEIALRRLQEGRQIRSLFLKFKSQEEIDATIQALRSKPAHADILYARGDAEAYWLAQEIFDLLSMGGWQVLRPTEVPSANVLEELKAQPLGITIVADALSDKTKSDDSYAILRGVFLKTFRQAMSTYDSKLSPNTFRIVVMPRP